MPERCPLCDGPAPVVHVYEARPEGETVFDLGGRPYRRELRRCERCAHLTSHTDLDLSALYAGDYMDATYTGDRLARTYERIMGLPPEASDNVARVTRIVERLGARGRLLDVGSGLGVFPARMKEVGWDCTALDPDPRAVAWARDHIGVAAVQADFLADDPPPGPFDLVTLNKVLEHVADPVAMLGRARGLLGSGGALYVELPDGEAAIADEGFGREEVFIEHLHAFSAASMALLAHHAGLRVEHLARLREPSTKFTLYAFLSDAAR
jgi:2-polyprenyl-3-methyl-5-hydroxy-6-metoxy-1,4-benzoquinol methylase